MGKIERAVKELNGGILRRCPVVWPEGRARTASRDVPLYHVAAATMPGWAMACYVARHDDHENSMLRNDAPGQYRRMGADLPHR